MERTEINPRGIGFTGMGCSGKSTLGKAVAKMLGWRFIEYDAFKRSKGEAQKLPQEQIIKNIEQEIMSSGENFVYDGFISSTISDDILNRIDAAVKVNTPLEVRVERAKARFQTDENQADQHANLDSYLAQQIAYENNTSTKLNKVDHEAWFADLGCLKACVDGTKPVAETVASIVKKLFENGIVSQSVSVKDGDQNRSINVL